MTEPVCSRWTGGWECSEASTQAGWLGCVFWALVSILFKPRPRPQTSRKPFITPCREGNMGKNQADHVAPSLATESWPAPSVLLQSPRPGNTHWLVQTAPTPLEPSSSSSIKGFSTNKDRALKPIPSIQHFIFTKRVLKKKKKNHARTSLCSVLNLT